MYMPLSYAGTNCPYFVQKDGKEWGVFTFLHDPKGPALLVSLHKRKSDACENALSLTDLKVALDRLHEQGVGEGAPRFTHR